MSNHSGSELLNKALKIMVKHAIACDAIKRKITREIIEVAKDVDCNVYEILENVGRDIGICEYCYESADSLEKGLCSKCIKEEKV